MPEFQNTDSTTNATLAQLLEVDLQLSNQEAQLSSQLESLQQKRQSPDCLTHLFEES